MSHSVQQRTQELGIRLSLGATSGDILKLVLGDGNANLRAGNLLLYLLELPGGEIRLMFRAAL